MYTYVYVYIYIYIYIYTYTCTYVYTIVYTYTGDVTLQPPHVSSLPLTLTRSARLLHTPLASGAPFLSSASRIPGRSAVDDVGQKGLRTKTHEQRQTKKVNNYTIR